LPDKSNEFFFDLEAVYGSIDIVTEKPGYSIILNDAEISQKTPYKIVNAIAGSYKIELIGKTHYTNTITIVLKEKENYMFNPHLIPYGKLVIISKLKELDFMLKDSVSYEKVKLFDDKFTYSPHKTYNEKRCKEILLKKGKYIVVPLDEKLPEVQIEIKNDKLNVFKYDEHLVKRKVTIDTGKYHARVSFNHQRTGRNDNIHVKGKKVLEFIPGEISLKIKTKLLSKEYNLNIEKSDINLEFVKEIAKIAKIHSKKILNKMILGLMFLSLILIGFFIFNKYEKDNWKIIIEQNSIENYDKYIENRYFFKYKKQALKFIQKREEEYWVITQGKNTERSYRKYLKNFSNPKYKAEALKQLKEIIWNNAVLISDPKYMKGYIQEFPDAENISEAVQLYKDKYWEEVKRKNSMFTYTYYMRKFPDSPYKDEAIISRNNVFFGISKASFWIDKGKDIKLFIISPDNLHIKFIIMVIFFIVFILIYRNKGKKVY